MARRSWPIEAVVGVIWGRRGNDSLGAASWLQFCKKSAWIWLQISLKETPISAAIFATITPRSGCDRASIVMLVLRRSPADRLETNPRRSRDRISSIAARSRHDRGSIGLRSWSSSTMFRCRSMEIQRFGEVHASTQWEEIGTIEGHPMEIQAIVIRTIFVVRAICCRPRDGDRTHQETPRGHR